MKRLLVIIAIILLGEAVAFAQATVPSDIKEVTLFSDQALVKRRASVKVAKGVNELLLDLGAFSVDGDSVSAIVFGEGELFGVQYREIYLKEAPQQNIKELEKKIEGLKDQLKSLQDEKHALVKKELFLDSVGLFQNTGSAGDQDNIPERRGVK